MQKSKFRKGLVLAVIVLFVGASVVPSTGMVTGSIDISNHQNSQPIINHTLPIDGATDIPVTGEHIVAEIYDADDDDLWVEVWSNFTGNWVEYASYDVMLDWQNRTWSNDSSWIVVDYNGNGQWDTTDLSWINGRDGWGWSGNWGFFFNRTVTDDWEMTECRTTYYWSVNVTDNSTWTNESYHFTTERANIYVDDDAPPEWYDATHVKTIQEGINNASTGDTVYVYNGTYYENVNINKDEINLIGEEKNSTIIDANENGYGIIILERNNISISDFTVRNGSKGILIRSLNGDCRNNVISNCNLCDNVYDGFMIHTECHSTYYAESNVISDCDIYNNGFSGVVLHNTLYQGIIRNNHISNCKIYNNSFYGIRIDGHAQRTHNIISGCEIYGHSIYGINVIMQGGLVEDNRFFHNNLLNDTNNAYDDCTNIWYNTTLQEGNYWSDYTGNDTNGDCIGDTPYNISGGDNQDLYPFMYPNGWINNPPYPPSDPFPEDGGHDVPVTVILNWTGGDPDPCDTVTYDVYFGVTNPPTKKSSNQTGASYYPPALQVCTKYYWQIRTWDNHGVCTKGPIWSFTTFCVNFPPDMPVIDGPSSGTRGETYIYSFDTVDPEWHDIYYFVDWGDGTNTSWLGPYESGEKIYVNHTWSEKGTYVIMARAKDVYDAIGDWGTLEVTMPKSKPFFFNFPLLSWLIESFPLLQRLLIALEVYVL